METSSTFVSIHNDTHSVAKGSTAIGKVGVSSKGVKPSISASNGVQSVSNLVPMKRSPADIKRIKFVPFLYTLCIRAYDVYTTI